MKDPQRGGEHIGVHLMDTLATPAPDERCLTPAEREWESEGETRRGASVAQGLLAPAEDGVWPEKLSAFSLPLLQIKQGWEGGGSVKESQLMDLRGHYNGNCARRRCGFISRSEIAVSPLPPASECSWILFQSPGQLSRIS